MSLLTAGKGLRGRALVRTDYAQEMGLLNTPAKRRSTLAMIVVGFLLPFMLTDDLLLILTLGMISAVGAIGLNLVTGYAGQVSLGHAFFIGIGAYTGAVLGGDPDGQLTGYGLPIWIWLPAAGVVAAIAGLLVGPIAVRLRGLYLAIVTLGLVFLGDHIFREARSLTGGPGIGRRGPELEVFGIDLNESGTVLGIELAREQRQFIFALLFLIFFAILGRNIARSGVGRAFSAVRDRDVAAAVIGVDLTKYKVMAFAMSSFFAGVTGALYYAVVGRVRAQRVRTAAVDPVHRDDPDRRRRHDLRRHHGRAVHQPARQVLRRDRRCLPVHQRVVGIRRLPVGVPARGHPLRAADHRVPDLRATWPLRDLGPRTQLLEGVAVLLLTAALQRPAPESARTTTAHRKEWNR